MPYETDLYPWEVGMAVALENYRGSLRIGIIERMTKTQLVLDFKTYKLKVRRDTGIIRYDKFYCESVRPATQEDFDRLKHNKLVQALKAVDWQIYPASLLTQVLDLVVAHRTKSTDK